MKREGRIIRGGGLQGPHMDFFFNTNFVDTMLLEVLHDFNFSQISHWNRLMSNILEFCKNKIKSYDVLNEIKNPRVHFVI